MINSSVRLTTAALCLAVSAGIGLSAQAGGQRPQQPGPQTAAAPPPPPVINQSDDPILRSFRWRSVGPASMGGRVDDIEAVESNPSVYYVGFATGGIWKTTNNGTTFSPVFDTYPVASIGDLAIAPSNPNIIYVGTGEPNNRQSSSFGNGMYKSTDAGKTFTNIGLTDTQSIARVVVHPRNPDIVYVAAVGHLFGPNEERGLFKTTDGGKTWTKSKFIDADTGFTDVVMDPSNPDVLLAASYQRRRAPHGFNGGGPGSGIWKTTNGGRTWTRLAGNGLPDGGGILGRIGLAVSRSMPNIVYAQIEVGPSAGTGGNVTADGKPAQPSPGGFGGFGGGQPQQRPGEPPPPPDPKRSGVWRSDDGGRTWRVVSNNNNRPMYYSQIRVDPTNPDIVYTMGAPFHKSTDGGKTFRVVQGIAHSDHHALWINPRNPQQLILGNDGGIDVSYDQGDTWEFINTIAVGQFYQISANMEKPYLVCGGLQDNGSWCGPSATRSQNGITNADWFRVGGGDGFYTQNDPEDPTIIFAESQDGNVNRLDLKTGQTQNIRPRGPQPARGQQAAPAAGGREDVTQPQPSAPAGPPAAPSSGEGQGRQQPQNVQQAQALLQRLAREMGFAPPTEPNIVPTPSADQRFRFYWNTPTVLSPHNPAVVYIGGDRLFISRNRGQTFTMTQDLTRNVDRFKMPIMGVAGDAPMASKHDGAGSFSHIVTVSESPVIPGVLWVGTNDGNVQVSRDGGVTWKNVAANAKGVPDGTHVSRVIASRFDAATAYVTFDGHRADDHKPYVFVTKDFGETFTPISGGLPTGNVNVIHEDPKNRNLLYLGTEYGFHVSLDGGKSWKRFMNGMPTVRVDDILVHPRDNDLIVGTHGRSIWIMDDITALQNLGEDATKADAMLLTPRPATIWLDDIRKRFNVAAAKHFQGENPEDGAVISYYLKGGGSDVTITISDVTGHVVRELKGTNHAGLNRVRWNLRTNPPQLPADLGDTLESMGIAGAKQMIAQAQAGQLTPAGGGGGFVGQLRRVLQGRAVEAGTYLVKLTAGGKTQTAKLIVEQDRLEY
ncbi:MAG TPA: hypothetical protein VK886_03115 [Vicinamibacterales bacterium]|nr:hypothetical protein [Vicinamibacterales bacterium]